jgi:protein subunit release factor A
MYTRYAESQGWRIEQNPLRADHGPRQEVTALIIGESVYSKLKYESGVHRVQWVPPMETQGRVFTSKLAVVVTPEADASDAMHDTAERIGPVRTYNFPQKRVTDHRIGLTLHELDLVLDGKLDSIVQALAANFGSGDDETG